MMNRKLTNKHVIIGSISACTIRLKDSKSEGAMLKETTNINKSLFVLGKVISALAERESSGTTAHIPYRCGGVEAGGMMGWSSQDGPNAAGWNGAGCQIALPVFFQLELPLCDYTWYKHIIFSFYASLQGLQADQAADGLPWRQRAGAHDRLLLARQHGGGGDAVHAVVRHASQEHPEQAHRAVRP